MMWGLLVIRDGAGNVFAVQPVDSEAGAFKLAVSWINCGFESVEIRRTS